MPRGTGTQCHVLPFFCPGPDASPATWARLKAPSWQVASTPTVPLLRPLERLHRPEGLAGGGHGASLSAPALRARKATPCRQHADDSTVRPPIVVGIQPEKEAPSRRPVGDPAVQSPATLTVHHDLLPAAPPCPNERGAALQVAVRPGRGASGASPVASGKMRKSFPPCTQGCARALHASHGRRATAGSSGGNVQRLANLLTPTTLTRSHTPLVPRVTPRRSQRKRKL